MDANQPTAPAQSRKGWLASAQLFSLNGRWPLPARLRNDRARGWDASTQREPLQPPQDLSEQEIARAQRLLGKQGWALIRAADGRLVLCRTI